MKDSKPLLALLLAAVMMAVASVPALARTNMLFILDGSNSMWGQVDGVAKIDTAKTVLANLMSDLPQDTQVGLMAYGHRVEGDCRDVQTVAAIGAESVASITSKLNAITPTGKTPIAYALQQSAGEFASLPQENNHVILISDGVETCNGDPCAAATTLSADGVDVRAHVVGFDISAEERAQLECIAENGKGQYFEAKGTEGFKVAVAEVQQVAQTAPAPTPKPTPKPSVPKDYFFDDFNGSDLSGSWIVLNQDVDSYIVENGELLVVNSTAGDLAQDTVPNLVRLAQGVPPGDWVALIKLKIDQQTNREQFFFGIHADSLNHIGAVLNNGTGGNWGNIAHFGSNSLKVTKGTKTNFHQWFWNSGGQDPYRFSDASQLMTQPIYVRLRKEGRSYFVAVKLGDAHDAEFVEMEKMTALRAAGNLAMGLYQSGDVSGESTATIDWVKIQTVD
jgi:hypothetical protein